MNKYEVLYILAPGLDVGEINAQVVMFSFLVTENGGVAVVNKLGL